MFDGPLVVAEYFHVNKIDWPMLVAVYAVVAVVVSVAVAADAAAAAAVSTASMAAHFDIDQLDTYDTD